MSKIFVDQVDPKTATTLTLGTTGDTVDIPSGVTLSGAGTITASAANLAASGAGGVTGTLPIANGGTGATTLMGAGLTNRPAFSAQLGFNDSQSIVDGVMTKCEIDTVYFDTDSAYDATTNYRFTIPAGEGGNYLFQWGIYSYAANTSSNIQYCNVTIRKNGSDYIASGYDFRDNEIRAAHYGQSGAFDCAAADYFELWGQVKVNSGTPSFYGGARQTFFGAIKLLT